MTLSTAKVLAALRASGWSQTAAARELGVTRSQMWQRVTRDVVVAAAYRQHAPRTGRRGRPPAHAALTAAVVREALAAHATQRAAAAALGVSPQAVTRWRGLLASEGA